MTGKEHWEQVYGRKPVEQLSWYRPHLERSLALIGRTVLDKDEPILDVGGGASTLVDDLLAAGYRNVSVLDVAPIALETARRRLGAGADRVRWLVGDVTRTELPASGFAFWHDRAVFHFLRDAGDRRRYVDAVLHALRPGGHILVATFGPEGPERCSGLEVVRYDAERLHGEFGPAFEKLSAFTETHATPAGSEQQFLYCFCRRP